MFPATLFITVKKWKQPKYLTTDEWVNKTCFIHTMKYYSTTKSNEILIYVIIWINMGTIMFNERQRIIYDSIYMVMHKTDKSIATVSR